jgi:hypothetical protein
VKLDQTVLADLAVALTPNDFVRVVPMALAVTPLGASYGKTRFASPNRTFKVIDLAEDLATSVAETLVRDRYQGRARRQLMLSEVDLWGATEVSGTTPLTLIDRRTTGVLRLGVSTEAGRGALVFEPATTPADDVKTLDLDALAHDARAWEWKKAGLLSRQRQINYCF